MAGAHGGEQVKPIRPDARSLTGFVGLPGLFLCDPAMIRAAFLFCALVLPATSSNAEEVKGRLSVWLSTRTAAADDYPLGLVWGVPDEEAAQAQMRSELLKALSDGGEDTEARRRLHGWIAGLPVTGRVPISIVDADWLSANPNHDPVILAGQRVILPKRPRSVTLVTSGGVRCQPMHVPGRLSKGYLASCVLAASHQVDWAWVVQPDGNVKRFGIASWNIQKQDEPAPGAWIWMPYREDKWAENLSGKLAAFLATQGVAPEHAPAEAGINNSKAGGSSLHEVDRNVEYTDPVVTANDWGEAGLLQTPTARMRAAGYVSMTLSRTYPYLHTNFFLQPLDWLEAGFRYTSVSNRLYGPSIAGDQAYKDKSVDMKFGLLEESAYLPQIALGMRDIMGTGFFSGEYMVANKRAGPLDWSLGLGWGYVGSRGNLRNPLGLIKRSFDKPRQLDQAAIGEGGNLAVSSYFHGPTALFGGVQYQSRWEPLILKLEYDGNDYQHEALANNQRQNSPWNVGATYRSGSAFEMTLAFERGNKLTLGITLQTDLQRLATPKLDDPARLPVAEYWPQQSVIGDATARDLATQTGWQVRSIEQQGHDLRVNIDDADAGYWSGRIDRANAVLHRDAPYVIDNFSFLHRQRGMELVEHRVDRDAWVQQQSQPLPPTQQKEAMAVRSAKHNGPASERPQALYQAANPMFQFEPDLNLNYNLGGPDGFILYQLSAIGHAELRLREDTWLQGGLQLRLSDNYDKFLYTAPSNMPRVRTYIREYVTSSKLTMPNLQFTHVGKLTENQFYSVYAGYLEMMFAGAGAEWLYRPLGSTVALGVDVNRVRQRDFKQDFNLRPYQVDTGHATLYWDTGLSDVLAKLSAGRYLAGDLGVTVDLSRVFQNGVRMGGFFTKTNATAQQFGEGSFDKGIYVSIPFDAMMTRSNSSVANVLWQPLIRDGGAKLEREVRLYDMTELLDKRTLQYMPAKLGNEIAVPSQKKTGFGSKPGGTEW
jgi:Exopolysaccharide biosynthesis protein YbjH/Capsule biosynthesis GfcC